MSAGRAAEEQHLARDAGVPCAQIRGRSLGGLLDAHPRALDQGGPGGGGRGGLRDALDVVADVIEALIGAGLGTNAGGFRYVTRPALDGIAAAKPDIERAADVTLRALREARKFLHLGER